MVSPINYTLDVLNPVQASLQGFGQGLQISNAIDQSRNIKLEQEQKQRDALAKQQQQEDLYNFSIMPNKTAEDYANIITRYPQLSEQYKRAWDIMDAGQQQESMSMASQIYAALGSNNPDVAKSISDNAVQAYENSGKKTQANQLKMISNLIEKNPQAAQSSIGMLLASTNPDKFNDIISSLGKENRENASLPYDLSLKGSQVAKNNAEIGKINAEAADIPEAAADRRQGVDNQGRKIEYDNQQFYSSLDQNQQQFYAKLDSDEKAQAIKMASTNSETPIKRAERLEKVENYAVAARSAAESASNAAQLANDVSALNDAAGSWHDRFFRMVPNTNEYNFAQKIETLKSQVFLNQIERMRGLGALTEAEGAALKTSIASLDLNQDPVVLQKNLTTIAQTLSRVAQSSNKKAQFYATNGRGYSQPVMDAAKELGITPAEAQQIVNQAR